MIPLRDRLLDQVDARVGEPGDPSRGGQLVPGLVDVEPNACAVADRLADRCHMSEIHGRIVRADLELEDVVAAARKHFLGLGDVLRGVSRSERPRHRNAVVDLAAEQLVDRLATRSRDQVVKRHVDRGLGEAIALHGRLHEAAQARERAGVLAQEVRGKVRIDRDLDRLRALVTPGWPADRGGLADPDQAVGKHLDDDVVLGVHRREGEVVCSRGRNVHEDGFDSFDLHHGTDASELQLIDPMINL